MYVDDPMILELLALLKAHGVHNVVIAPGSRHYPIVRSLEVDSDFQLYSVVDERSMGFFAIGVIRAIGAPVAVLTTSGTASVNLASAVADAYYQRLPLVAITADRSPQLLNQMEDQMINQVDLFQGMVRKRALLRTIQGDIDHWYDNRVLNEALLAMRVNGSGPVHINVPIIKHGGLSYTTKQLPRARVISHHTPTNWGTEWSDVYARLNGKRVMVLWGQSDPIDEDTREALDRFTSRTDSLIVADHLGNLHHAAALVNAFPALRTGKAQSGTLAPDIVITVGGTLFLIEDVKSLLRSKEVEHWRVDPDGQVVDPFWQLTDLFQITPVDFFRQAVPDAAPEVADPYRQAATGITVETELPGEFGEISTIGALIRRLPADSALHIGNSAVMRMAHLFPIDPSITVLANRGVNGIDGSLSATVGFAAVSRKPTFLVIGDLSFFYDMNALGIRHLSSNLRILLINNGGGALMHDPVPPSFSEQAARHTSAGHEQSARGWVESVGIRYLSATTESELVEALDDLTTLARQEAVLLEVFTDKLADISQLQRFHYANSISGASVYRKVRKFAGYTLKRLGLRG